ncbi:MAG: hypothetical protein D8M57_02565 [Candidatus Scalindua sp. AMX11]|nr:MAG: hypothetical protein DWQ00_19040 [Candidatus Scalindua sp.]RZV98300.1 MAG: hypothetical protein EX341_00950 [Candidatus Scalindua sp. SCAELEC01]TDE66608.1 MAG: hypothetical protein D8M57_02565 [Candidatus Scalindua sp. AMX11]
MRAPAIAPSAVDTPSILFPAIAPARAPAPAPTPTPVPVPEPGCSVAQPVKSEKSKHIQQPNDVYFLRSCIFIIFIFTPPNQIQITEEIHHHRYPES